MAEATDELVVLMTHGADHELSSVAFTIANGGMTAGLKVSIFLTSAAVDLVRKGAVAMTHVQPLEPLPALVKDFLARGGTLWACTPCVKARGYEQEDLIDGVVIAGSSVMQSYRLAVIMVEVQGFSYAETAETLGVPIGTVRSRLARGRALLQGALWRQASQVGIATGR